MVQLRMRKVQLRMAKFKYSEIYDYLVHQQYPDGVDREFKHALRKRAKFFTHEEGRLFYAGGVKCRAKYKPRLVVSDEDTKKRIISSIHDQAHLGRDKTLSEITPRYYWPDMYNDICSYVSVGS